ncbi:uncharacterized protein LOC126846424 isoform X2 [Adelges cooleyi]|uniref:uncharacterized protein LOC126846424 isoform X2 n=1 Tax=Adelges cooleyi TaxID=133065 RepID=UPI00217F5921|nr:uncharacterized protein LOC126846424 isoform X2 [Adelges cooleyi]
MYLKLFLILSYVIVLVDSGFRSMITHCFNAKGAVKDDSDIIIRGPPRFDSYRESERTEESINTNVFDSKRGSDTTGKPTISPLEKLVELEAENNIDSRDVDSKHNSPEKETKETSKSNTETNSLEKIPVETSNIVSKNSLENGKAVVNGVNNIESIKPNPSGSPEKINKTEPIDVILEQANKVTFDEGDDGEDEGEFDLISGLLDQSSKPNKDQNNAATDVKKVEDSNKNFTNSTPKNVQEFDDFTTGTNNKVFDSKRESDTTGKPTISPLEQLAETYRSNIAVSDVATTGTKKLHDKFEDHEEREENLWGLSDGGTKDKTVKDINKNFTNSTPKNVQEFDDFTTGTNNKSFADSTPTSYKSFDDFSTGTNNKNGFHKEEIDDKIDDELLSMMFTKSKSKN